MTAARRRKTSREPQCLPVDRQHPPVDRIVSGGQTGVDRAALDVALELGIPCGGWCPRGRKAEDGTIPLRYPLQEADSAAYSQRTVLNVRDSDGTLILVGGPIRGGTSLTRKTADRLGKPCLVVDVRSAPDCPTVRGWLRDHAIGVLNIAGSRGSQQPGVKRAATRFLRELFQG